MLSCVCVARQSDIQFNSCENLPDGFRAILKGKRRFTVQITSVFPVCFTIALTSIKQDVDISEI